MLLGLLEHIDLAHSAALDEVAHALVLRGKAELLGVHEVDAVGLALGNHLVRLLQRHGQGLLDDDVLTAAGSLEAGLIVGIVGHTDVHDLRAALGQELVHVVIHPRDTELRRDGLGLLAAAGVDGHYLGLVYEALVALKMDVGDETRAEYGDLCLFHAVSSLIIWLIN